MKKIFILFLIAVGFLSSSASNAQFSFSKWKDTVAINYIPGSGVTNTVDSIINPGSFGVTLRWAVINCNFPADWFANGTVGLCDNQLCTNVSSLWPSGASRTSGAYSAHTTNGDYHLQFGLPGGSTNGTFYITAKLLNASAAADSTTITFAVTYTGVAGVQGVVKGSDEISLYPNPATTDVNIVFDAIADVKTVAIYNIIGKVMSVYKVSGNSANLSLENVPSGIYFARLMNSQGEIVATRKFTKQ